MTTILNTISVLATGTLLVMLIQWILSLVFFWVPKGKEVSKDLSIRDLVLYAISITLVIVFVEFYKPY